MAPARTCLTTPSCTPIRQRLVLSGRRAAWPALVLLLLAALLPGVEPDWYATAAQRLAPVTLQQLLAADEVAADALWGGSGQVAALPVAGQPFARAKRLRVATVPTHYWEANFSLTNQQPVVAGTLVYATLWLRGEAIKQQVDTGGGVALRLILKHRDHGDAPVAQLEPVVDGTWRQVHLAGALRHAAAPGELELLVCAGYQAQVIDLGGALLAALPAGTDPGLLPRTVPPVDYDGRAADAPWRAAAAERIARLRQAELTVTVRDAAGAPVAGAQVRALLTRHAFAFGTAVGAGLVADSDTGVPAADRARYREVLDQHFASVVFENDLKWRAQEEASQHFNLPTVLRALDWLDQRAIPARGHVLVWPGWQNLPQRLRPLAERPDELRAAVAAHVSGLAGALRGRLSDWDVINECNGNKDLMAVLGDDVVAEWFRLARAADPGALLIANETSLGKSGGLDRAEQAQFELLLDRLTAAGAPWDGLGGQMHLGLPGTSIPFLLAELDRVAARYPGKHILITELDVDIPDPTDPVQVAWQADQLRDVLTAAFSHPAVSHVVQWGYWAGRHWKPNAALWAQDWSLRPHGQAYLDLVGGAWHTDAIATTDAAGVARLRGFKGTYAITVTTGGRSTTTPLRLDQDRAVTVQP
jgi:endo-1,4-beta-xylanase